MGICTFYDDECDVNLDGGIDAGIKLIEIAEKRLKNARELIKDTNNCQSIGSYMLEEDIPNLLNSALKCVGHSITYKDNHNLLPFKKYGVNNSVSVDTQKECSCINPNNSNFFFDKNSKIDVSALLLNYLDHDDIESLNILKNYSEIDFLAGMNRECEAFWHVQVEISCMISDLKELIKSAECSKVKINEIKKQFDEDIIGWFKEIYKSGRLLTFDTFDYDTSRAVWAYNYYTQHPEIGDAFRDQSFILSIRKRILENKDYYSDYSNLYQYRDKLYKDYEREKELEAYNAEWDRKYFAELRCKRGLA